MSSQSHIPFSTKRDLTYLLLSGFFITNAIMAETIGGKLFKLGPFTLSVGVIAWPVVFVVSDLVNEFFGRSGVARLTFVTAGMIFYSFLLTLWGMAIPAVSFSPVSDEAYSTVFGQSTWIMAGSLIAFVISQSVDVAVFWVVRHRTQGKWLWARSTGSTLVSQLVDTYIVMGIAFWLPGKLNFWQFFALASSNYCYKCLVAVGMTPLIYVGHGAIDRFIGVEDAHRMIEETAHREEA